MRVAGKRQNIMGYICVRLPLRTLLNKSAVYFFTNASFYVG